MARNNDTRRKPVLLATLLLAAIGLSGCMVAPDRDDRGGWGRHHHWKHDRNWNDGPGWRGDDDDGWKRRYH